MSYKHLSVAERNQLYTLRMIEKLSMSLIAKKMNRSKSTISRELKRNTDEMTKNYFPDTAKEKMKTRRKQAKGKFKNTSLETIE